jgi:metal-dependent HD superfamily phosphatase/phosphodiesterase
VSQATGPEPPREPAVSPSVEDIQRDPELSLFIASADRVMEGLGFTEHGFRHANLVGRIAFNVLSRLGFQERTATLACIAGYLHDIGNMATREAHGQIGAVLAYGALRERMPPDELATVMRPSPTTRRTSAMQ